MFFGGRDLMVRIKDIAALAGASTSAVSFVLNGKGTAMRISQEMQRKILESAGDLGYVANVQARRLKSADNTPLVALYWPVDQAGFPLERLLEGTSAYVRACDGDVEMVMRPYKAGKLVSAGVNRAESKYNALLFVGLSEEEQLYVDGCGLTLPQCFIGNKTGRSGSAVPDLFKAGRETARLFSAHKATRASFIGKPGKGTALLSGFKDGCREYGLQLLPEHIFERQASPIGGSLAAEEIAALSERPDAVLFESDLAAIGALSVFARYGITIPGELKLVACGSHALLEYLTPSVSVVTFPIEEMAEDALSSLVSAVHGGKERIHKLYEPEFIFRESCGAFPGKKAYRIFV